MSKRVNHAARTWLGVGFVVVAIVAITSFKEDRDIPRPSNEVTLTADQRETLQGVIALQGFNCPAAKLAFKKGPDAYGDVLKVHCGPSHRQGVYERAVFRVTFTPDDRVTVRPW